MQISIMRSSGDRESGIICRIKIDRTSRTDSLEVYEKIQFTVWLVVLSVFSCPASDSKAGSQDDPEKATVSTALTLGVYARETVAENGFETFRLPTTPGKKYAVAMFDIENGTDVELKAESALPEATFTTQCDVQALNADGGYNTPQACVFTADSENTYFLVVNTNVGDADFSIVYAEYPSVPTGVSEGSQGSPLALTELTEGVI